jgi:hypothetical protein
VAASRGKEAYVNVRGGCVVSSEAEVARVGIQQRMVLTFELFLVFWGMCELRASRPEPLPQVERDLSPHC